MKFPWDNLKRVTIVKCTCGSSVCSTYSLSEGNFYQGCGWSKETAQEYADAINFYRLTMLTLKVVSRLGDKEASK